MPKPKKDHPWRSKQAAKELDLLRIDQAALRDTVLELKIRKRYDEQDARRFRKKRRGGSLFP